MIAFWMLERKFRRDDAIIYRNDCCSWIMNTMYTESFVCQLCLIGRVFACSDHNIEK